MRLPELHQRPAIERLENRVQKYEWGSATAIPKLLGLDNPRREPHAELWLGAHPKAPSLVVRGEERVSLEEMIARAPVKLLGARTAEEFDGRLPFLLKVLAADGPLSIQSHPSPESARAGFERENRLGIPIDSPERNYRDASHKPELICAMTPFSALKGFRPVEQIVTLLGELCPTALANEAAQLAAGGDLKSFFSSVMSLDRDRQRAAVREAVARSNGSEPLHAWIRRLDADYPGDVGVLGPLFLNLVHLQPGEALYLPSGELHAYLEGVGVEIMASSDNVLRGGLTPKHIDVPELLSSLSFESSVPEILHAEPVDGEAVYRTPAREFELSVIDVGLDRPRSRRDAASIEILLVTEGSAVMTDDLGGRTPLRRGDSVLVPAGTGYQIEGEARIFKGTVPGSGPGLRSDRAQ